MLWLLVAALLLCTWFLWQLFGPSPPIIVSKETTYITAPLGPNGLPDYAKFLLETSRAGVTPENNAAVLMWQAMGPGSGSYAISPGNWQTLCRELQIEPAASSSGYLQPLYCMDNRRAVAAWLHQQGRLHNAEATPSAAAVEEAIKAESWPLSEEANVLYNLVETQIGEAMNAPWNSEQLPPLASWLDQHHLQLDLLVEASLRTKFHSPDPEILLGTDDDLLPSLEAIQNMREIARLLNARAMWQLGEGNADQAWENLLAIYRWARLARRGSTIVEQLVGIAIEGIASNATLTVLSDPNLPLELARQIQRDLDGLQPASTMADSFAGAERLFSLKTAISIRDGAGSAIKVLEIAHNPQPYLEFLDYLAFDCNPLLVQINQWYAKFAAACRLPTHEARRQECAKLEKELQELNTPLQIPTNWILGAFSRDKRSQMFAAAVLQSWLSSPALYLLVEDRTNNRLDLTRLAAALAVYRIERGGEYPRSLDELAPRTISQVPTDLYYDKPFIYRREAGGYLLYSTGENGIDDGGSNEQLEILAGRELNWSDDPATEKLRRQIPAGADDLSIRVPTPAFKLAAPPTLNPDSP